MPKFSSVNCCLIYFLLIGLHISHQQTDAPEHCKGAQQWPLNGRALVRDYKGRNVLFRVLLLTFVSLKQCDSDCEHALKKLDSLHDQFPSARILAIAPADEPAADVRTFAWKFPHIRFEHEHKKSAIWQWFRSGHLDQFIFDRCSRHSIRLPPSASGFPPAFALTAQAIRKTITQQPCGPCEYDWDKAAPKWTSLHPPVLKKVNVMGDLLAAFSTEIGSPKDGFMHAQKQLAFAEQHQHAGVGSYHRQRQNSHPQQQTQPGGNHQQQQQFNQEQLQLQRQREELARLQQQQVERERLLREHEERLRQRHQMEEQQRRHWAEQQQRHQQQQQQQPYGHPNIVADATASPPVSHNQQHISVQQPATRQQQQQQQLQQPSLHNQQPTSTVRYAKDPFGDRYGFGLGRPRNQQQQQNERRKPSSAIAAEQQPQTRTRTKAIPQSAYDQQLQIPEAPVRTEEAVAPLYPEGSETADYYGYEDEWTTEMPSLMQIPKPTKPAVPTTPTLQQQDKNFGFELPCSGFSDENCFQQQTQLRPNEIHRCCRGRILFSDQCIQGKCSNMTTQLCCIQRFLQAKLTCCSDERQAETGVGDHFSRCCFDNFVDGEDPCCPREYAAEQWRTVHELCLPNVEMDLTGVKVPVPLLGTSLITEFDFGKTDKWRFECRYGGHVEQYSFFEQSASEEHGNEEGREIGDD